MVVSGESRHVVAAVDNEIEVLERRRIGRGRGEVAAPDPEVHGTVGAYPERGAARDEGMDDAAFALVAALGHVEAETAVERGHQAGRLRGRHVIAVTPSRPARLVVAVVDRRAQRAMVEPGDTREQARVNLVGPQERLVHRGMAPNESAGGLPHAFARERGTRDRLDRRGEYGTVVGVGTMVVAVGGVVPMGAATLGIPPFGVPPLAGWWCSYQVRSMTLTRPPPP